MKTFFKIALKILTFAFLTIVTQIGGIAYLISLFLNTKWKMNLKLKPLITFTSIYLFFTFLLIPIIAPIFGREKVIHNPKICPTNYLTILLNRIYVRPSLNTLLLQTTRKLENTTIKIHYLDANFPFINKFPLLPHLSHNDGKKIDISLIYENKKGEISTKQKSISGYGIFEHPKQGEYNQIKRCIRKGYFQYDYPKYITFGSINSNLKFSKKGTKKLIQSILNSPLLGKLFIEPHLKNRLHLDDKRIRYHGCRAVRHDDHIHIQLK